MSARDHRLDEATVKFKREDLLRAAREADARARATEAAVLPSKQRPGRADQEIDIAVEPMKDDLEVDALLCVTENDPPPSDHPTDPAELLMSPVRTTRTSRPVPGTKVKP